MRAYCKAMDIDLIDVIADEGYSASNLKRPGLQAALTMLRSGKACTLIVVKLDRLTRCVKDLGTLCEQYFSDEKPYTLLSLSDSINTRSASGKLVLNVLTSVAQWEREAIADRTREAMAHLKQQGVKLGGVPYGWRYSSDVDANGRRLIVKHPEEQKAIKRILLASALPMPRPRTAMRALQRSPLCAPCAECPESPAKQPAAQRAAPLRAQSLKLRDIGAGLPREGLSPPRGVPWAAATGLDSLPRAARPRPIS